MKACIIQPPYTTDPALADRCFASQIRMLDSCDESIDLIVLPESCDSPCYVTTKAEADAMAEKYNSTILKKCAETAVRCKAVVCVNARSLGNSGFLNTTYVFDESGAVRGKYYKQHLTPGEVTNMKLESDYSFEPSEPYVLDLNGVRYAFLTCYDFYFYENFANVARYKPDIIIGCSHQRTDKHETLKFFSQFLAYNTNAYVVRASVTLGNDSPTGGASMIVAPTGEVLLDLYNREAAECVTFNVEDKLYKPAGFNNPPTSHPEYVEKGRRPWKYRPAGSAIVKNDALMPYPRVCAHRGFKTIAPENSLPALGAAVAMGAEEVEFDLWYTKDKEIVSIHDSTLDRVSDGTGKVVEHTYEELTKLDFGVKYGERFKGLHIIKFEDILKKLACHCIMNVHIKSCDEEVFRKIIALIDKYDCRKYVYFVSSTAILEMAKEIAPDIPRCAGGGPTAETRWDIVDRAIRTGCRKVQFFKPCYSKELVDKAHAHGIICNVFWSDDVKEARELLEMGMDTILTNDYHLIAEEVKRFKEGK
ncbi:MAG: hypothetical protein E7619_05920 [Ruminococcaceae bacterium]|nr:hypothetical protein [Oscillospiraceae bacterium]